jgi:hypothetical protein
MHFVLTRRAKGRKKRVEKLYKNSKCRIKQPEKRPRNEKGNNSF